MKFWTGHLRPDAEPVLVREGFSWGALIFGPLWLAAHRAWIPAALSVAAIILVDTLTAGPSRAALSLALVVCFGLFGNDMRRWSLRLRGFTLLEVVGGRDQTEALGRWLERRPDLAGRFLPPGTAR